MSSLRIALLIWLPHKQSHKMSSARTIKDERGSVVPPLFQWGVSVALRNTFGMQRWLVILILHRKATSSGWARQKQRKEEGQRECDLQLGRNLVYEDSYLKAKLGDRLCHVTVSHIVKVHFKT